MYRQGSLACRIVVLATIFQTAALRTDAPEAIAFFESKIRPVLAEQCYRCHSAGGATEKETEGRPSARYRAGVLQGGETGPAVIPGEPAKSLLLKAAA